MSRKEEDFEHLERINANLLAALKSADELWAMLPFDSGDDIAKIAERVRGMQSAAIEFAETSYPAT